MESVLNNNKIERIIEPRTLLQRRNLLIISSILSLYSLAGIEFDKLPMLGALIKIKNPGWIPIWLWLFWLYAFIGFWNSTKDIQRFSRSEFQKRWKQSLLTEITKKFSNKLGTTGFGGWNPPQIEKNGFLKYSVVQQPSTRRTSADGKDISEKPHVTAIPRHMALSNIIRGLFEHLFTSTHFYDYTLPLLFALLVPTISWIYVCLDFAPTVIPAKAGI